MNQLVIHVDLMKFEPSLVVSMFIPTCMFLETVSHINVGIKFVIFIFSVIFLVGSLLLPCVI